MMSDMSPMMYPQMMGDPYTMPLQQQVNEDAHESHSTCERTYECYTRLMEECKKKQLMQEWKPGPECMNRDITGKW